MTQKTTITMVQVKLVRVVPNGTAYTVCWLPADKRIKPNSRIRLKGELEWWTVEEVWATQDRTLLHDDWHVGGL